MKQVRFILMAIVASILVSCGTTSTVPITGRKHRLSVTDEYVLSLSTQQYSEYMKKAKASTNATNTAMVKRVGQRLANAVESYLSTHGYANEVKNFAWEFNLVADNQVNAFCMPGGKIVVYEGILPVTQNEASLAIVLGHEIAHAVAKHSAEQMTKSSNSSTLVQLGGAVASAMGVGQTATQLGTAALSQGLSLLNLKYSRDNESEADYMGLVFAAMAGYDPQVAVSFWQRMSAGSSSQTATWMSSHPSDEKRIADIQKHMPEALKYYKPAGTTSTTTTKTIKASSLTKKKK
ncbi:MAG: M48 family metallopeptidase [Prevotella sp.]|nr:M48 family metallopeptidase [Prevotella sp.]